MNLAQLALENGGYVKQLILPSNETGGMGTMNPSIFVDEDKIFVNIRALNYILYHSESQRFYHLYGPLQYIHPDADPRLRTYNYIVELDNDLNILWHSKIDTTKLDTEPLWDFVGLEDGRLFKVNGKYYLAGVRRDTTPNGQGRMELSEILIQDKKAIEIDRIRIPAPGLNDSYCEKNWVIVLDKEPFTFVKWHHPVEIVQYKNNETKQLSLTHSNFMFGADLRGGSQVIPFEDGYLSVTHETYLFNSELGNKNARYRHRFVFYDKNLKVTKVSKNCWSFMDSEIEFCCGIAIKDNNILISFGFQDNSAFILKMPKECVHDARFN